MDLRHRATKAVRAVASGVGMAGSVLAMGSYLVVRWADDSLDAIESADHRGAYLDREARAKARRPLHDWRL